jgi:hypothetical protein
MDMNVLGKEIVTIISLPSVCEIVVCMYLYRGLDTMTRTRGMSKDEEEDSQRVRTEIMASTYKGV